jgi:transposase-like protein
MMSMPDQPRGTDRAGRRSKRFLSPSQKYEIWLQLVRGETTLADAAAQWQVDRSTILRIRAVAKDGALAALAASRPGKKIRERDHELEQLKADNARLGEALKELAVRLTLVEGKDGWG